MSTTGPEEPDWLPEMLDLSGYGTETTQWLYDQFIGDFIPPCCWLDGREVWIDNRKRDDHFEEGFWHVVTRDNKNVSQRQPDFRRAERLLWCAAVIRNVRDEAVRRWAFRENSGRCRLYLWLHEWDYLVILEPQTTTRGKPIYRLITAYHIDNRQERQNLEHKRRNCVPEETGETEKPEAQGEAKEHK